MPIVLFFGGQKEAVCAALRQCVGEREVRILVLPKTQETSFEYQSFDTGLDDALAELGDTFGWVLVHGENSNSYVGGAVRPRFGGAVSEDWTGYAEGSEEEIHLSDFETLLTVEGLSYVGISLDESPDFNVPHVTAATFPWDHWLLLAGAARDEVGEWIIRQNEEKIATVW